MRHTARLAPALVVLAPLLAVPARAQTLDEVREAVRSYFDSDEARERVEARFAKWGEDALPHIRTMAVDERLGVEAWHLVCCLRLIETDASLDLLVEILDGRTRVSPEHALHSLITLIPHVDFPSLTFQYEDHARTYLEAHERFEPAIRKFLDDGSWLNQINAVGVAAQMGWGNYVELIEPLLEHDNLALRRAAAEAIEALTGNSVEIAQPTTVFPAESLIERLVSAPVSLGLGSPPLTPRAFFLEGLGKGPHLMLGDGHRFHAYPDPSTTDALTFSSLTIDVLALDPPGRDRELISLVSATGFAMVGGDSAVATSPEGRELWSYSPPSRGLPSAAILHGPKGPYGVALGVGGSPGIVARGPGGTALWDVPEQYVLYELASHPELPGLLLFVGGDFKLIEHGPDGVVLLGRRESREIFYATVGVLLPDSKGEPRIVLAGKGDRSQGAVKAFDRKGRVLWTAPLSDTAAGVALLEVEGRRPVLGLATDNGELHLFDEDGTLLWGGLTSAPSDASPAVFGLRAGSFGEGRAGFLVDHGLRQDLYEVDVAALPVTR